MTSKNRHEWLKTLPKGSVGAEIGVAGGAFSLQMLAVVRPRILYLVDRYGRKKESRFRAGKAECLHIAMENLRASILQGVARVICDYSESVAAMLPDDHLDWVYIDADHSHKAVLADLRAWYPKVKQGGIVAGHDYHPAAKARAARGPYTAVPVFVNETYGLAMRDVARTQDVKEIQSFWFRKP